MKPTYAFAFIFYFIAYSLSGNTQEPSSLYYLCVGSGNYNFSVIDSSNRIFSSFEQLPEAINSSKAMDKLLKKYGKGKGIFIRSDAKKTIEKSDILDGLEQLWKIIESEKKPNPLIIFYYAGHGFTDGLLGSQFLLSGNYPTQMKKDNFDERIKNNMYILELSFLMMFKRPDYTFKEMDELLINDNPFAALKLMGMIQNIKTGSYQSVILLDCCRDSLTSDELNIHMLRKKFDTLAPTINSRFLEIAKLIKEIYENSIAMLYPVIFSGKDMALVKAVDYPQNQLFKRSEFDHETQIGPICRETIILLDQARRNGKPSLDLRSWLKQLISPASFNPQHSITTTFNLSNLDSYPLFK